MRKFIIALAASAVLFMSPARAEFTDEEKVEAAKLIQANLAVAGAIDSTAHSFDLFAGSRRQLFSSILQQLAATSVTCMDGWRLLSSTTKGGTEAERLAVVRADEVASAFVRITQCANGLREAATLVAGNPGSSITPEKLLDEADALDTFNKSLGYSDPLVVAFPRIVGPHGTYDPAQAILWRTSRYLMNATFSAVYWYGGVEVYDEQANGEFSNIFKRYGDAIGLVMRIWGLETAVVLPIDQAIIDQDFAASTAFRPPPFFRLLRAIELMNGLAKGPLAFSGRKMTEGYNQQLFPIALSMGRAYRILAPINSDAEVRRWAEGGTGGRTAGKDGTGRFLAHMDNLADFWKDADRWNAFAMGFFFDIIPPAPTGTVTCGANTTLQGQVCVAPAPVVCPGIPESKRLRVDSLVSDDVSGTLQFSCRL